MLRLAMVTNHVECTLPTILERVGLFGIFVGNATEAFNSVPILLVAHQW